MAKRFYTILIVPDVTSKFRKIVIPKFLPIIAVITVSLVTTAFVYLLNNYLELGREYRNMQNANKEAQAQQNKMAEITRRMEDMQDALTRLAQFGQKLRSIASLESTQQTEEGAKGGPEEPATGIMEDILKKEKRSMLEKLEEDVSQLSAQALRQEELFKELIEFFSQRTAIIFSTPSVWPVRGWVSSGFGYRISPFTGRNHFHEGIDIATNYGKEVQATADGIVTYADVKQGFGRMLEINHGNGFVTRYAHNSELLVKKGQRVERGETIAKVGNSGLSTGPHMHYEVRLNDVPINPLKYIIDEVTDARR